MATNDGYVYGYPVAVPDPPKSKPDEFPVWLVLLFSFLTIGVLTTSMIGVGVTLAQGNTSPVVVLDSLTVSNLNITDDRISGEWRIGLSTRNPKCPTCTTTNFDKVVCSVAWSGVPELAIARGGEWVNQQHQKRATVYLNGSANLGNTMSGVFMRRDIVNNNGSLAFEISLSGSVEYGIGVPDVDYDLKLNWSDIRVPLLASNSTPNTLMGAYHNIAGQ